MITCGFLPIFVELSTNCPQIRTVIHNFGQMTCIMVSPYSDTLSSLLVCPCFRLSVRLIGLSLFSALCPAYWSVPVSGSLSGLLVCPCFRLSVRLIGLPLFPAPCPTYWSVPFPNQFPHLSQQNSRLNILKSRIRTHHCLSSFAPRSPDNALHHHVRSPA